MACDTYTKDGDRSPGPHKDDVPLRRRPLLSGQNIITAIIGTLLVLGIVCAVVALVLCSKGTVGTRKGGFRYTNVPGFFMQDLPETDSSTFDYIAHDFGLLPSWSAPDGVWWVDTKYFTPDRETTTWDLFTMSIAQLNSDHPEGTSYRVLFLAAHGEGYHNTAEDYFGESLWSCYWGRLNGNETTAWGPDAELTPTGQAQARAANAAWRKQVALGLFEPQSLYSSPLKRSMETLKLTWEDIPLDDGVTPKVKELLRGTIGGQTSEKRRSKTYIQEQYPAYNIEKGFEEEDPLWTPDLIESADQRRLRIKQALDDIFAKDDNTYISITCHSQVIMSILEIIGHQPFWPQTGAMIPVVVRVEKNAPIPKTKAMEPLASVAVPDCPNSFAASTPLPKA